MKLYTHEWEMLHDQLKGYTQCTGFRFKQKVFKCQKLRIVTNTRVETSGEWTKNLRKRLDDDKKQEETFNRWNNSEEGKRVTEHIAKKP